MCVMWFLQLRGITSEQTVGAEVVMQCNHCLIHQCSVQLCYADNLVERFAC